MKGDIATELNETFYCSLEERTKSYTVQVPQEHQEDNRKIVPFQGCQWSNLMPGCIEGALVFLNY